MLIHHGTSQGDLRPSVHLSVCERFSECLHERVNTSGCGADTDKQIAAHTSLGAHLQTAAGNLLTSVAPIRHVSAYLCPPYQTCAFGKLTSHAVVNLPITFHNLFLAILTSGFGRNRPKNLGYLSHGKLNKVYHFLQQLRWCLSPSVESRDPWNFIWKRHNIPIYIGPKVMAL